MPGWLPTSLALASLVAILALLIWSVLRRHRGMAEGPLMLRGPDGRVVGVPPRSSLSSEAEAALRQTIRPTKDLRGQSPVAVHDATGALGWPAWLVSFLGRKEVTWSYLILEYDTACPHTFTAVVSWRFKPARGFRRARFLDGRVRGVWFRWDGWARNWPDTRPEVSAGIGALMRELAGSLRTKCDGIEYTPGLLCISFAFGAEFQDPDLADALATFIDASER
ncbi:MAG: hypothetical protein ACIAQU_07510, partial [Phycisphaerales bacterium JB064]